MLPSAYSGGGDLVFKVGGKTFAQLPLEPAKVWLSFKCEPAQFVELVARPGIIPAPYRARFHWVALAHDAVARSAQLKQLVRRAYDLAFRELPKKTRETLISTGSD